MAIQSTLDLFRACIVRIGGVGHRYFGTAAWVAPNILLTCRHVVESAGNGPLAIYLRPFNRQDKPVIIPDDWIQRSPIADLALITFPSGSATGDHPCIYLDHREPEPGASLLSLGFTGDNPYGEELKGEYVGWANNPEFDLRKFQLTQVVGGFSGGPMLLSDNFIVCGVVKESRHLGYDAGGHYIPISEVWTAFPELRDTNLSAHLTDARWCEAAFADRNPQRFPFPFRYPEPSLKESIGKDRPLRELIHLVENKYRAPIVITAPPSMGKTWLAGLYMNTRKWRYDFIAWLHIVSDFHNEADFLVMFSNALSGERSDQVLSVADGLQERVREKIHREIASISGPKLIVINGVKSPQQVGPYLAWLTGIPDARILITSLLPIDSTTLLSLSAIQDDDLFKMLGSYLRSSGSIHTQVLLDYTNRNPRIINLIRQNTPKDNWAQLKRYLESLTEQLNLSHSNQQTTPSDASVIVSILNLSDLKLDEKWLLLQFCALPDNSFELDEIAQLVLRGDGKNVPGIGIDAGYENFEKDHHSLHQTRFYPRSVSLVLDSLARKGWLTVEDSYYRLPSLIKEAVLQSIPLQSDYVISLVEVLYRNYMGDEFGPVKGNTLYQQHLRAAIAVIPPSEEYFSLSRQLIRTLEDLHLGYLALPEQENYLNALSAFEQQEGTYPSEKVLDALLKLITLHRDVSGNYLQALEFSFTALAVAQQLFGPDDDYFATIYYHLSSVYGLLGRYEEALEWIERCLTIEEGNPNVSDGDRATTYYQKGSILSHWGRPAEALEWIERCLIIQEGNPNVSDGSRASTYHQKGNILHHLGRYEAALECIEHCLTIQERNPNVSDDSRARTYYQKARILNDWGRYKEGLEWIERCLTIQEGNPNVSDDWRADTYYQKGWILNNLGRYKEALEWIERCLTIQKGNPNVSEGIRAQTYYEKGRILDQLGRYEEALEWIERCLMNEEENPNVSDDSRAATYYLKGNILENLGHYEEGLEWIDRCLTIQEGNPNVSDNWRAFTYYEKGRILDQLGRYKEALEWIERCLIIREGNPNFSNASRAGSYYQKGKILDNLGQYAEALNFANRCLTIREGNPNIPEEFKGRAYLLLSLIHAHLKNESLAIEYYDRAVTILKDTPHTWIQKEFKKVSDLINSK